MRLDEAFEKFGVVTKKLDFSKYEAIIAIGTIFEYENLSNQKIFLLSPMENQNLNPFSFSKYEVGSEEGVLALLINELIKQKDEEIENFLDEIDIGYLSAESNFGEEEAKELAKEKSLACIIGKDLLHHPKSENLAKLFGMLNYYCNVDLMFLDTKISSDKKPVIAEIVEEIDSFDGAVVFKSDVKNNKDENYLYASEQFALSNKIQDGDKILVLDKYKREFKLNKNLKGTIALLPTKENISYRYHVSKISRINHE